MEGESPKSASTPTGAVFLSYASEDAAAAERIANALRAAHIEVWFDKAELRGGDAWDRQIRKQIHDCALFIPIISAHSQARLEGYFRREWKLAADRTYDMAEEKAFLMPVAIDDTSERSASVPEKFRDVQWTRLPAGETPSEFIERVSRLLSSDQVPGEPHAATVALRNRSKSEEPARKASPFPRWGYVLSALAAIVIVGVGYLALDRYRFSKRGAVATQATAATGRADAVSPSSIPEKSIAVLPFVDMSEKHDQEYFSDGLSEELIDLLTKVPDLHVPARTSSFYFKGKPTKLPDIAHELGVAHILEGSVRKSNNRIRVTAQLIRATTGYHLWSETYDRGLSDVFKMQDDIANAVVQALQITLMGGPLTRQTGGTQNLEAYQMYLRALGAQALNTQSSLEAAGGYLDQAIKLDQNFGLAWSTLALNVIVQTDNGFLPPKEGYERSRRLAQRALQSSPDLGDAHAAHQYVYRTYDWDWAASEAEGRQALGVDPSNHSALMFSGMLSATLGRWDDAERELRAALVRDPLNTYANANLGDALYSAGRYADAEAAYRKVLDLAPHFLWARMLLGKILLAEGRFEAALAMVQQDDDKAYRPLMLPIVLQANGRIAEADEAFAELIKTDNPYFVAMTYAYRGDRDHALEFLDRSYEERDQNLVEIVGEPLFKNLANDQRYRAFLRKMNLPQ